MDLMFFVAAIVATLSLQVMIHELGHCIAAKLAGVEVEFYDFGVGPTLLRLTDRQGTVFNVKALPLGGFAQLLDGWGSPITEDNAARSFREAPPASKLAITLAGSSANFLTAFVIILVLQLGGMQGTVPVIEVPGAETAGKAYAAGLRDGDRIVGVDGAEVTTWQDIGIQLFDRIGDTGEVALSVSRDGERHEFAVAIGDWQSDRRFMNVFEDIGISHGSSEPLALEESVIGRVGGAIEETFVLGITTAAAGFKMIFREMSILNFMGPLELLLIGEDSTSLDWVDYARLFALFSIAMGIINLLPGPVVDGVGVMLATGELVTRKRPTPRVERNVRYAGVVLGFGPLVLCIGYEIARALA
ncbi:MAG: M50 family metallopeptidase [Gammaproteobacteria bacterium]|nr:M50 family metallopeptidase [Gammaproteobacteria bacterium]